MSTTVVSRYEGLSRMIQARGIAFPAPSCRQGNQTKHVSKKTKPIKDQLFVVWCIESPPSDDLLQRRGRLWEGLVPRDSNRLSRGAISLDASFLCSVDVGGRKAGERSELRGTLYIPQYKLTRL